MKGVELAVVATTLLLLASSQELDDYVDKEAISKAVDDYKGKARVIHSSFLGFCGERFSDVLRVAVTECRKKCAFGTFCPLL